MFSWKSQEESNLQVACRQEHIIVGNKNKIQKRDVLLTYSAIIYMYFPAKGVKPLDRVKDGAYMYFCHCAYVLRISKKCVVTPNFLFGFQ